MRHFFVISVFIFSVASGFGQNKSDVNYDEAKVPSFELPDPLVFENGEAVKTPADWQKRRSEILSLFETHVYGKAPAAGEISVETVKTVANFLGGKAVLKEVKVYLTGEKDGPGLDLLIISPKSGTPVPTFLTLNFSGNHSVHPSPEITIPTSYMRANREDVKAGRVADNRALEAGRGFKSHRWPVEKIIDSGVALATVYYGDIDPDFDDGFENGIHAHFGKPDAPDAWGSIASWAWGMSRVVDYLVTDPLVDSKKIAMFGHSRLGKTSLWAGANDERFALVISNNSGCGGAALSRRRFGEKVKRINTSFPHWFNDNFPKYNDNENELPVDQHQLIALMAPRMVYVASAVDDKWADPNGEFLAAKHASPVYELLGETGIGDIDKQPEIDQPVGDKIRYHVRTGKHDVTDFDWEQYIKAIKSL